MEERLLAQVIEAIKDRLKALREKLPQEDGTIEVKVTMRKGGIRSVKVQVEFSEETT